MFAFLFGLGLFETVGYLFLAVVVVLALVWFVNSKAFRDLWASGRADHVHD